MSKKNKIEKLAKTDEQWKQELSPEVFHVMREHGTERAFTGALYKEHAEGDYVCAACQLELFKSETKYESGSGWPSFYAAAKPEHVEEIEDKSHGMRRVEVRCGKCGGHLGHVFPDGPAPTGLRYCINSASLKFKKK